MYCSNCGNELSDKAVICPQCGCIANKTAYDAAFNAVKNENAGGGNSASVTTSVQKEDKPNPALSLLSFFMPLFGIIIYFADRHKTPVSCRKYLKWSIISIAAWILFYVLYVAFIVLVMFLTES